MLCAGIFQSCLKKGKDDTDLSSDELSESNVLSFNDNRCKEFNLTNYARFSKRISVKVVLNNTSSKCDVKDTSFLEAFGITAEKLPSLKQSCKYFHSHIVMHSLFILRHHIFIYYMKHYINWYELNIYRPEGIIDTWWWNYQ